MIHGFWSSAPDHSRLFLSLTSWIQFLSFSFFKSFVTSSLHLFFGSYSCGVPIMNFLTSFICSILLRCPHHLFFVACIHLAISSPFISLCNLLVLLILHPSSQRMGSNFFLKICLSKTHKLFMSHTMSRFHMQWPLPALSLSRNLPLVYLLINLEVINP